MKIRILTSAFNDLAEARDFYERQGEGIGEYFLDSLFSDIDSLALYAGIHRKFSVSIRCCPNVFPLRFTINLKGKIRWYIGYWICVRTRAKYALP